MNSNSNSETTTTEAEVTIENETDDALEILENQIQFLDICDCARLKVMDLIMGLKADSSLDSGGPGIEEQYSTVERDIFLKWDDLESKKHELRQAKDRLSKYPTFMVKPNRDQYEKAIEAVNEYQEQLETAQFVLEFEEEQHALGNR